MRRFAWLALLLSACAAAPDRAARLRADVATLADPVYDGRRTGTNGAFAAAAWIDGRMREAGLQNVRFQEFTSHAIACKNVIGELPGARADRLIVVGAHYDHLGSAIENGVHTLYPGADDNASGVAGLLAIARELASMGTHENTIVFVAFSGEEIGLLGSSHYARTAPGRMIAMLNLDMIGRLGGGKLIVGGVATGEGFEAIVRDAGGPDLALKEGGVGPSDYTSFFKHDVPVLWFFSGAHPDHHKPTDTVDKIDAAGMVRFVDLVVDIVRRIDGLPEPPAFHRVEGKQPEAPSSDEPRTMVKLGTMPDYAYEGEGVLFTAVREDGAGYAGGMRSGDVLVELDGDKIGNVNDYTEILYDLELNEAVPYAVMRDGQRVTGTVTPTSRW